MAMQKYLVSSALLFTLGMLTGCAGSSPFESPSSNAQQASARYSADGSTLLSRNRPTPPSASATPSMPSQLASRIGSSVSDTVHAVGEKFSDALDIEPRVIPADDPASLASIPQELSPSLYVQAALRSERQGDLKSAQSRYQKAREIAPNDVSTAVYYARFLDRQGKVDQAIEVYQQALSIEPRNAVVLNDLAVCHARHGGFQYAIPPLKDAVVVQPENSRYRNNLANVLIAAGQTEAAVDTLLQAYPPAIAHYNVGYLLYRQQKIDEATQHLMRSLQLDPNMTATRDMLSLIDNQQQTATRPGSPPRPPVYSASRPSTPSGRPASHVSTGGQSNRWDSSVYSPNSATRPLPPTSIPSTQLRKLPTAP